MQPDRNLSRHSNSRIRLTLADVRYATSCPVVDMLLQLVADSRRSLRRTKRQAEAYRTPDS